MARLEGKITMGHLLVAARRVVNGERSAIVKSMRKMLPNPLTESDSYFKQTSKAHTELEWIAQRRLRREKAFGDPYRKNRKRQKAEGKISINDIEDRLGRVLGKYSGIIPGQPARRITAVIATTE